MEVVPGVSLTYRRRRAHPGLGDRAARLSRKRPRRAASSLPATWAAAIPISCPIPTPIQNVDILVSESTYGNRELDPYDRLIKQLHAIVARATRLQSKIVIPAFSLGRTQRMVYCLQELFARAQGAADPDLRRQPAGHAADRDSPRSSRRLHAAGSRAHGQGPALFRLEVRRVSAEAGTIRGGSTT